VDRTTALGAFELMLRYRQVAMTASLGTAQYPGLTELQLARASAIYEGRLVPGQRVAVFAQVSWTTIDAGAGRGPQPMMRLIRPQRNRLLVTDRDSWLEPPANALPPVPVTRA